MAKQRSKSYSRNKGHAYERKIVKELKDIGFTGVVTSRQESKSADDNKIDIVDTENKLPINIQLKSTQVTPSYFSISKLCSVKNKPFVIIWNKQEKKNQNICSIGEIAMIPKQLLYNLLKLYLKMNESEQYDVSILTEADMSEITLNSIKQ